MADQHKKIETFVSKVLEIQNANFKQKINDDDLKSIAEELGLSEDEWKQLLGIFDDHITRAKGFINFSNWEDAAKELEQAIMIKPHDVNALYLLAYAYKQLWLSKNSSDYKTKAEQYARTCISLDASHSEAIKLLSDFKRKRTAQGNKTAFYVILSFVGLVFILVFGMFFYFFISTSEPETASIEYLEEMPAEEAGPESIYDDLPSSGINQQQTNNTASKTDELPVKQPITEEPNPEIAVTFVQNNKSTNLKLDTESSLFKDYTESYSYTYKGNIIGNGIEISELKLKFELLDKSGTVVASSLKNVIEDYSPVARSMDLTPVEILIYEKKAEIPSVTDVHISVHYIKTSPAPQSYEPSKTVGFDWLSQRPANFNIEVKERFSNWTNSFNDDMFCKAVFEVKNTGNNNIKMLKFELQWYNGANEMLSTNDLYINATNTPTLKRDEIRVAGGTWSVKDGKKHTGLYYKIVVSEIN